MASIANCEEFNLPPIDQDTCNPEVVASEVERMLISGPKSPAFTNIAAEAEWNTRISENTVGDDAIRSIDIIGDLPAGTPVNANISLGRIKKIGNDYVLNFTVDDISDATYNLFRALDEKVKVRLFGLETAGGKMYHFGNKGKLVDMQSSIVLARGREATEVINGTLTWRASQRPQRMTSPIFESDEEDATPDSFDSTFQFDADETPAAISGVGATAAVTDAEQQFEFNAIAGTSGLPNSMSIEVDGVEELTVDFPADYSGQPFRYTSKAGDVYNGYFTNGTVPFES